MTNHEVYRPGPGQALLIHPQYASDVDARWFSPAFWGVRANAVGSGGRGSAWFVDYDGVKMVLRHYMRGGFVARISKASYLFTGERRTRSFAEFRLLKHLHEQGLPVPRPVAASYNRVSGCFYQAGILLEEIANVTPLGDKLNELEEADWERLGKVIRQFHHAGVYHADLNCFNVLVREKDFFLIDFDKGRLIDTSNGASGWKENNLKRLHRSLSKVTPSEAGPALAVSWAALLRGYQKNPL